MLDPFDMVGALAASEALSRTYREHGAKIHAALVRRLHDLDLAEEAVQEAMVAAVEQWDSGVPHDPAAWLVQTAFFKAIDRLRRVRVDREKVAQIAETLEPEGSSVAPEDEAFTSDDALRLVFLCCHPALPFDAQVALTLRTVSCLTTAEIARAFLVPEVTMAQRLVRAKAKIRDARIPFRIPDADEIDERIDAVMSVVYLIFSEGYAATAGDSLVREDLCVEALRLARLLVDLVPRSGPLAGLRALLLLTDARRVARVDGKGDLVLLEDQDRALWNPEEIARGLGEVDRAIRLGPPRHPYTLQAAIAAVHVRANKASETDWGEIVGLYEMLRAASPSPIVDLNHAVAVAMRDGPEHGLELLDSLAGRGLDAEHLLHAARADLLRRLGRREESRIAYGRAAGMATNEPERRFLVRRLAELDCE